MSEGTKDEIYQDIHGSRIVRDLTPTGWTVRIFSPWPNPDNPAGEECESHAEAVELAKQRKKDREAAGIPAETVEKKDSRMSEEAKEDNGAKEDTVALSIGEGLELTIDRALSEVE